MPGEQTSPTQPFPVLPAPFARQGVGEDILTTRTPEAYRAAVEALKAVRYGSLFTPLAVGKQTALAPSFDGGAEWGGAAVDRETDLLYVNSNEWISLGGLVAMSPAAERGERVYLQVCSACHGIDLRGAPPQFPSLAGVTDRLPDATIIETIKNGRGRMPGSPVLTAPQLDALVG